MKRLLLLLSLVFTVALGGVVEAFAAPITSTSQFDRAKCYTVKTNGRGAWYCNSSNYWCSTSRTTDISGSGSTSTVTVSSSDTYQQWAFILYKENLYAYNVGSGKFLTKDGTLNATPGDPILLRTNTTSSTVGSYPLVAYFDDSHYLNFGGNYNVSIGTWGASSGQDDEGNCLAIEEVTTFDNTAALAALATAFGAESGAAINPDAYPTSGSRQNSYSVTVSGSYGTLYRTNGTTTVTNTNTSGQTWRSNSNSSVAGVTFAASAERLRYYQSTGSGEFRFNYGGTGSVTYTITAPDGYVITGFSLQARASSTTNNRRAYININGATATTSNTQLSTTYNTYSRTGLSNNSVQFSIYSQNGTTYAPYASSIVISLQEAGSDPQLSWPSNGTADSESGVGSYPTLSNPHSLTGLVYTSSDPSVATINQSTGAITLVEAGETVIKVESPHQAVSGTYYLSGWASYLLTVTGPRPPVLEWTKGGEAVENVTLRVTADAGNIPSISTTPGLAVTYNSSDPSVATVSSTGIITLLAGGTVTITASSAAQTIGDVDYKAATASVTLNVVEGGGMSNVEVCSGTFFPSFDAWGSEDILKVFYDVNKAGRYYPTDQDWEDHGFNPDDMAFVRSHVRRRDRIYADQTDHSVTSTAYWKANRTMFYNVPSGVEKMGSNGYPAASASDDNFSMWNYVDLFGSWNHSIGHAPGAWTDAAHKNGVNISGGIIFFDDSTGYNNYVSTIRAKDNSEPSGFKYVRAIISMLMYFGQEGISFNYEYGSPGETDQRAFMTAIYDLAAQRGYTEDCRFNLYSFNSSYTSTSNYAEWGTKGDGRVTDIMLNYSASDFTSAAASSKTAFANQVGEEYADRIYAGVWIVSMARTWSRLQNNDVGIALWGEHNASRFWTYNSGDTPQEFMENYTELLERGFSGGNFNPNNTPTVVSGSSVPDWGVRLNGFHGIASFMTERSSVVGELPFLTNFQLGNGFRYNYKGKKTGGAWYNMATQDIVPTYRWLVVNDASASTKATNTSIVPRFSYDDAFMGGTCLKITGAGTTAGDIVLYKSDLYVTTGNPIAKIAVKTPNAAGATNLQLKLQVDGTWKTYPVGSTTGTTWEEMTINLSDISAGQNIQNIALRLTSVNTSTKLFVGMLELNDDVKRMPYGIKDLKAKIYNESKTSMSVKAWWDIDREADEYGHVYNDELNIDHFELLYKPSQNGDITELSRTSQWATIAPNIVVGENDDPWIGIRSVSTDLKTYSDVVWINIGHNIDAEGNLYGDGYGYPTLASYGSGGNAADWRAYVKLKTAYTEGASVQDIDYDISDNVCDPYVGSTNPNCPPIDLAVGNSILADITAYETADQYCLKVNPGDNIDFYFTHQDNQGGNSLSYGLLSVFADWYGLGNYADDPTYSIGKSNSKQDEAPYLQSGLGTADCLRYFNFTVPADAAPGRSHLRLVFNDAWSGQPGPTQATTKGWAIDFPVEVMDIGQEVGLSPSEVGKDQGQAPTPDGLPGAPVSTWGGILDGTAYYVTDYTTSSAPVVLYNNDGNLTGVASTGDAQESLAAGSVADIYNTRFVARREGDKITFVNGHGEYLGTADLTENYTSAQNEGTATDGNYVSGGRLIYISGRPMLLQSAEYPLEVTLRPTDAVTIDDSSDDIGIATWSAPFETILPDGVDAYAISTNDDSEAFLRKIEIFNDNSDRVVPANIGVVLITIDPELPSLGSTYQMLPAKSSSADDAETTLLGAQTAKTYDFDVPVPASKYYILGVKNGVRKFYRAAANTGTKLGPNKAYLIPENSASSGMSLVFKGDQTQIGTIVTGISEKAPAFDLQGRRVNKDNFKGVYIQNGRKVVKF